MLALLQGVEPDTVAELGEALKIMGFMEKDHHIDSKLFRLFLTSGAYLDYAREYMNPEQIDEVDIHEFIQP